MYIRDVVSISDLMDSSNLELLNNKRIINMSIIDYGKTMSIANQYIQRNILQTILYF